MLARLQNICSLPALLVVMPMLQPMAYGSNANATAYGIWCSQHRYRPHRECPLRACDAKKQQNWRFLFMLCPSGQSNQCQASHCHAPLSPSGRPSGAAACQPPSVSCKSHTSPSSRPAAVYQQLLTDAQCKCAHTRVLHAGISSLTCCRISKTKKGRKRLGH